MIDSNDAPEGYEARIADDVCNGCAFWPDSAGSSCESRPCMASQREDGQTVIFVKRKPHLVATGGRRPTPPEWAERFRQHFRDGDAGFVHKCHALPLGGSHWKQTGRGADILFVEWLP